MLVHIEKDFPLFSLYYSPILQNFWTHIRTYKNLDYKGKVQTIYEKKLLPIIPSWFTDLVVGSCLTLHIWLSSSHDTWLSFTKYALNRVHEIKDHNLSRQNMYKIIYLCVLWTLLSNDFFGKSYYKYESKYNAERY